MGYNRMKHDAAMRVLCACFDLFKRTCIMLPVVGVCALVATDWYVFVLKFQALRMQTNSMLALLLSLCFTVIVTLLIWSYFMAVFTSSATKDRPHPPSFDISTCRRCTKCSSLKPERAHHCSICGTCSLKFDHHCPWISNCVAFANYKFFVLFLFYCTIGCVFFVVGSVDMIFLMFSTSKTSAEIGTSFATLFAVISCIAFAITLFFFLGFHFYLLTVNRTTLEFGFLSGQSNPYDLGSSRKNFEAVFGPDWRYWLIPVHSTMQTGWEESTTDIDDMLLRPMGSSDDEHV